MVGNSCSTTLPSVRSPCDIWWPNTATRVGHHLDRTIQVRDMETAWVPLSGAPNASSLCSLTSDPPQVQIGGGPPHSCSQSFPLSLSLPPRSSGHIYCKPARLKSLLAISTATLCCLLSCLSPGLWKSVSCRSLSHCVFSALCSKISLSRRSLPYSARNPKSLSALSSCLTSSLP